MVEHATKESHRPVGELFSELSKGLSILIRDEIELAKTEMSQKMTHVFRDVIFLILGGFIAYAALLVFLAAAVFGLATVMPLWLSALLIGLGVSGIAFSFIQKGLQDLKRKNLKPERTIETVKEDVQWAKEQI
jgi:hypothetical protein